MVVRPQGGFSVFSAMEESDSFVFVPFPETLHEVLEVFDFEAAVDRSFVVAVCQRDETVFFVELGFVHDSHCPLSTSLELASVAFSARQVDFEVCVSFLRVEGYATSSRRVQSSRSVALEGMETAHVSIPQTGTGRLHLPAPVCTAGLHNLSGTTRY